MTSIPGDKSHEAPQSRSGHKVWRRILLGLAVFVAAGALFGGGIAVVDPHGAFMGAPLLVPMLQQIPLIGPLIDSLLIPGSALLLFVFIPQTVAMALLLRRQGGQYRAGIICGALLVIFTLVEIIVMPNFLSPVYLAFGLVEIVAGILCDRQGCRVYPVAE